MQLKVLNQLTEKDVLPLRKQEIDLLYILRHKYKFGSVEIVMRDGLPVDILKTVERTRLGSLSTNEIDQSL